MQRLFWSGAWVLFFAVLAGAPAIARAQTTPDFGTPPSGSIPILYNDRHVYTKPDVLRQDRVLAALVRNGTVLIPLRSMFEQMGATVSYDPSTQTVTASKPGASVTVAVGKPEVVINGQSRPLDVPPIMYHGQILVPVRVISEGMGAYVQWLQDQHLVVVRYIPPTPPPPPPTAAPPPPPPPPPPTPAPYNWSGVYIGANVGGILNHDNGGNTCVTPGGVEFGAGCSLDAGIGHMNALGLLGGVQLGANWQGGPLVIGVEGDYDGSTLQNSSNFYGQLPEYGVGGGCCTVHYSASENMTSFQTERLRLGYAWGRTMIYATGGWAQANVTMSTNYAFSGIQYPGTTSIERTGTTEGLGGEWYLTPRLSFKVEGLLYNLQPYTTEYFSSGSTSGYRGGKDFYFHGGIARIGLNWKI
jgi:hypothetical protein